VGWYHRGTTPESSALGLTLNGLVNATLAAADSLTQYRFTRVDMRRAITRVRLLEATSLRTLQLTDASLSVRGLGGE
jgi:hypothetical protein